jgi:hypothetical protein
MAHLKIGNPSKGAVSAACLKQPNKILTWEKVIHREHAHYVRVYHSFSRDGSDPTHTQWASQRRRTRKKTTNFFYIDHHYVVNPTINDTPHNHICLWEFNHPPAKPRHPALPIFVAGICHITQAHLGEGWLGNILGFGQKITEISKK